MSTYTSSHRLRLNDLLLSAGEDELTGDESGRWYWDVYGSDFTTGTPEPLEVTMGTLLQDGARVVTQGYGNREVTFYAVVGGVDSAALAEAEKMLALNLGRRGELGWTPPDGWAPETVFDIETSSMVAGGPGEDDDLIEVQHNERVYLLRFVCQPFVRAASTSVVAALSVPVAPLDEDVIDPGTATTRWSARIGTLFDRGAYLSVENSRSPRSVFTPAAPIDITTQPYISLSSAFGGAPYCDVNGARAQLVGSEGTGDAGLPGSTRYYWRTDETVINKVEFGVDTSTPVGFRFTSLRVRNLPPFSGTLRQSQRSILVDGSTRTQGTLEVAAPEGQTLGTVIFYSTTGGAAIPSLRAYEVVDAGNPPTANAAAVSGFVEFLGTPAVFDIPVADLAAGKVQILARLALPFGTSTTAAVNWTAQTVVAGHVVGPSDSGSVTATLTSVGQFKVVALGIVDLPTVDLPAESDATVQITLSGGHHFDEAWLFNLDQGAVTVVEAGARSRVWIETATTDRPRPAIYVGNNADRTDAFHDPSLVVAWGTHEFAPPLTNALVVTSGCESPSVGFWYYARFMNFVAHPAT